MDFAVCDTFFNDVIIFILVSHFTPAFPGVLTWKYYAKD